MACPPLAIYDAVKDALADVAPMFLGRKHLAEHAAPRRFVWVFTGEEGGAPAARVGGNARVHHADVWSVDVHCWGEDFEESYRLRQALLTTLRGTLTGASYRLGRTVVFSDAEHTAYGDVLVVTLQITTPLADGRVPALGDDVKRTGRARRATFDPGEVRATGTNPPPVRASGCTHTPLRVAVAIVTPGPLGVATFRFSLDGGRSWSDPTGTAPSVPLADSGLTLHFAPGLYAADNRYVFSNPPPQPGDGQLGVLEW